MDNRETLLLTYGEAAHELRMSVRKLYEFVKDGAIAVVRIGASVRFDRRDVMAFIDQRKVQGAA